MKLKHGLLLALRLPTSNPEHRITKEKPRILVAWSPKNREAKNPDAAEFAPFRAVSRIGA